MSLHRREADGTIGGYSGEAGVSGKAIRSRVHLVAVTAVLGLGLGGVAFAQHATGSVSADVTLLDGKLRLSQTTFTPGRLTLVVVNEGKLSHALAIMGTGLQPRRTPTLLTGKSARLVVTVRSGMYHVWDPVRSSMSHATMLTVRAAAAGGGATSGGTTVTGGGGLSPGATGGSSGSGTSGGMPGMDPNDPCAGMM